MIKEIIQNTFDYLTETTKTQCIERLKVFTLDDLDVSSILNDAVYYYPPIKGLLVIEVLEALQAETAIRQALTKRDSKGLNLYYQALEKHSMKDINAINLIQKLAQHSESLPTTDQISIHFNSKAAAGFPLYNFIFKSTYLKLELCLQLIFKISQINADFMEVANKHLLAYSSDQQFLLKFLFASGNKRLMTLAINHFGEKVFFPICNTNGTPHLIHFLMYDRKINQDVFPIIFNEIDSGIERNVLPSTIYVSIFLNTFIYQKENIHRTLLSLVFLMNRSVEFFMNQAKIAFQKKWLSEEQYHSFLFNHPAEEKGFTFLHEVIRVSSYPEVYSYITRCLEAIAQDIRLLDTFKKQLLTPNKAQFSLLRQGINNHSRETAELILNLFFLFFPTQIIYEQGIETACCQKDKPEHNLINSLVYKVKSTLTNKIPVLLPLLTNEPTQNQFGYRRIEQIKQLNHVINLSHTLLDSYESIPTVSMTRTAYAQHGFLAASDVNQERINSNSYSSEDSYVMDFT